MSTDNNADNREKMQAFALAKVCYEVRSSAVTGAQWFKTSQ